MENLLYLDCAASTPILPESLSVVIEVLSNLPSNPSSVHACGRKARILLEGARDNLKSTLNSSEDTECIFVSSGTEANNIVFSSFSEENWIVSEGDHPSLTETPIKKTSFSLQKNGEPDFNKLEDILKCMNSRAFLAISLANNETGVLTDLKSLSYLASKFDIFIHLDLAQAIGKIPISLTEIPFNTASISGQKMGGPQGSGALFYRQKCKLLPFLKGGGQEFGIRSGTQNIASIAGFSKAISFVKRSIEKLDVVRLFRDNLEALLKSKDEEIILPGSGVPRLPNFSCIVNQGFPSQLQVAAFDMHGIMISAGSACASGTPGNRWKSLRSMGLSESTINSAIRLSLPNDFNNASVVRFIDVLDEIKMKFKEVGVYAPH